jgi:hypothetical protein
MRLYWRWKSGSRRAANGFNGDPGPVSGDEPGQPAVGRTTPPWRSGRCEPLRCRMPAPKPTSPRIVAQDGFRSIQSDPALNFSRTPLVEEARLDDVRVTVEG